MTKPFRVGLPTVSLRSGRPARTSTPSASGATAVCIAADKLYTHAGIHQAARRFVLSRCDRIDEATAR
jgi:hypothetical protein